MALLWSMMAPPSRRDIVSIVVPLLITPPWLSWKARSLHIGPALSRQNPTSPSTMAYARSDSTLILSTHLLSCKQHQQLTTTPFQLDNVAIYRLQGAFCCHKYWQIIANKSLSTSCSDKIHQPYGDTLHTSYISSSVWKLLASNGTTPVDIDAITIMVEGDHGDERFSAHNVIIVAIDFGIILDTLQWNNMVLVLFFTPNMLDGSPLWLSIASVRKYMLPLVTIL